MSLKKQLLIFAFALLSFQGYASHLQGGEIVWKCKPNGKYQFTLVLYRECGGVTLPTTAQSLATNAGVSISCAFISTTDVVPSCYTGSTTCAGATSGTGKMQKYVYRSGDITLTGTPPASGWYFTWSSCCRPSSITNVVSPGGASYLLRAIMYPYTPPGATSPLSAGTAANPTCFDSSPNFLEDPQVISCTGVDVVFNNLGYDPDLDSLYYNWSYPWDASSFSANPSTNSVNFASGYTYNSPLPSGSSSTPASIAGETGEVTFNSGVAGSWATCVVIEEWRCGQKVGEIYRDIPIVTLACTPPTGLCSSAYVDEAPDMSLTPDNSLMNATVLTPVTNTAGDTIYYYTEVFPGDTVRFKITAYDVYPNPNCTPQNIQFSASGGNLSSAANYGNANSCLFNPPCATLTSLNPGGVFTYPGLNDAQFNWNITCDHLFYPEYQCGTLKSEYSFYLRMQDDQCPINRFSYKKVVVKVKNYMPAKVDVSSSIVSVDPFTNQVSFNWSASIDTGFNFDYYLISGVNINGQEVFLDTLYDWSIQSYTSTIWNNYFIEYRIYSVGGCGLISEPASLPGQPYLVFSGNHTLTNDTVHLCPNDQVLLYVENKNTFCSSCTSGWYLNSVNMGSSNDTLMIDSTSSNGNYSYRFYDSTGVYLPINQLNFSLVIDSIEAELHLSSQYFNSNNLINAYVTNGHVLKWSTSEPAFLSNWCHNDSNAIGLSQDSTLLTVDILDTKSGCITKIQSWLMDTTSTTFIDTIVYYDSVTVLDTVLYAVTDTLIIDVSLIGINPPTFEYQVLVYPNPTNSYLYVDVPQSMINQSYSMEIKNSIGQSVFGIAMNQPQIQINFNSFGAAGSYTLSIKDSGGNVVDTRVIILQ